MQIFVKMFLQMQHIENGSMVLKDKYKQHQNLMLLSSVWKKYFFFQYWKLKYIALNLQRKENVSVNIQDKFTTSTFPYYTTDVKFVSSGFEVLQKGLLEQRFGETLWRVDEDCLLVPMFLALIQGWKHDWQDCRCIITNQT